MKILDAVISKIEEKNFTFAQWLIGISSILLIRFLFEAISSPPPQIVGVDVDRLVHHYLFFITLGLLLGLCVFLFLSKKGKEIFNWVMFGMLITWLPPIFDLILTRGHGSEMNYICAMPKETLLAYFTFFGPFTDPGITLGMRIEVLLLLAGIFYYVKTNSQSFQRAIFAVLLCYTIIFIYFASPSLAAFALFALPNMTNITVDQIYTFSMNYISLIVSWIFYYLLFAMIAAWFYRLHKDKFLAFIKNTRIERLLHYCLMFTAGVFLAIHLATPDEQTWSLGILSFATFLPAIYAAWMFSVGINDIVDLNTDKLSAPQRPLVTGALTIDDVRAANLLYLVVALLGGYLAGPEALFFILAFIIAYYIYSSPPLHLKRIPILSSFLIATATLTTFMAGFFAFAVDRQMQSLPFEYIVLVLTVFTLASNIRDLKDVEADRAGSVLTLPVIFGQKKGARIVGILVSLSFLLVPTFLRPVSLFPLSIPFALFSYFLVVRKPFREWPIFSLYFTYAIFVLVLICKD